MDGEKNRIFIIRGLILGGLIILLVIFLLINKSDKNKVNLSKTNQRDFVTKEITPTAAVIMKAAYEKASKENKNVLLMFHACLLYTSPSPRDRTRSRMPSSA